MLADRSAPRPHRHVEIFLRAARHAKNPSVVTLQRKMKGRSMVEEPATTPRKPGRKGGRPSRAEASAKALLGVDRTVVNPVAILREIAADRSMPGSTRVSAAKALLALPDGSDARAVADDAVSTRAIQIMAAARRGH
jgi:hypothetical protein